MKDLKKYLKIENAFVHLYGKKQTKPGRKMGHVTILSKEKAGINAPIEQSEENFVAQNISPFIHLINRS